MDFESQDSVADAEKTVLGGVVVFLRTGAGSKSDAVVPFLYMGRLAGVRRIALKGDNPFENRGLVPWDGKAVELSGAPGRGDVFVAEEVRGAESFHGRQEAAVDAGATKDDFTGQA